MTVPDCLQGWKFDEINRVDHIEEDEPKWNKVVTVTVLDTVTGETRQHAAMTAFYWQQGGGFCDCNREMLFKDADLECGLCLGCHRYLITEVDGMPADPEFNDEYPEDLKQKFMPIIVDGIATHTKDENETDVLAIGNNGYELYHDGSMADLSTMD